LGSRAFVPVDGYARSLVLAAGQRKAFRQLERVADVVFVGEVSTSRVDIAEGLAALKARGIESVLCEGGPRLAARLLEARSVDRIEWLMAPTELQSERAVPALAELDAGVFDGWQIERIERLGDDVRIAARPGGTR
jgi:riboflavin biosynthesis pyrimidine reductase